MKLTVNQTKFADEYIRTGNISQAYKNAYPNVKRDSSAAAAGSRMLRVVKVKSYIDGRMEELRKESIAEQDEILQFLTSVMRGEIKEPVPLLSGGGEQRIVEVNPNVQARRAAAELLGKRYVMWTDKHQVEGSLGVTIVDDIEDDYEN